jgi:hypothetical protein
VKIMLTNWDAVIRTHSWPSCAPIGCHVMKPGMICSLISRLAWVSAIRGSVS